RCSAQSSGLCAMVGERRESIDSPDLDKPRVGSVIWARYRRAVGRHGNAKRHAYPSGVTRLASAAVYARNGLECEKIAAGVGHFNHLSAVIGVDRQIART